MNWSERAEQAVSRVPFFVRKKVRQRVEQTARQSGAQVVRLHHVEACRKAFVRNMENEVRGFQVEGCFGLNDCPNRATAPNDLLHSLEQMLARKELKRFLKEKVGGPLKLHHELRVSLSECPNGCSRPQIVDVGLIGANRPQIDSGQSCSHCAACLEVCREEALVLPEDASAPTIRHEKCLACGQCTTVCPTGTLQPGRTGYRILLGGKLGRHPQLGQELAGIYTVDEVMALIEKVTDHYMKHNVRGERFADTLARSPLGHDREAECDCAPRAARVATRPACEGDSK